MRDDLGKNREYSLSTQAAYVFTGKFFSFLLLFLAPIILVRVFSQEEYGIYQQALLISVTLIEVLKWGLLNSLFYFFPLSRDNLTKLLAQTFYVLVFIGIPVLPLLYLGRSAIADYFGSPGFLFLVWPIGIFCFFMVTSTVLDAIFILEKKSKLVVVYEAANQAVRVSIVIGLTLVFRSVAVVIWGLSFYALLRLLILYSYLKINYRIRIRDVHPSSLMRQIRYAFPIGAARLAKEIGNKIDKYILSGFLSPGQFALYSIANFKIPFINIFYAAVGNVLIPAMTEYSSQNNLTKTRELWHKMILKYAAVTIPAIVFFTLYAKHIIVLLYTARYIDSISAYRIFLFLLVSQMLDPSTVLRACGETRAILRSHLYAMLAAIAMSYILIQHFGMIGGAISVVCSSYIRTGFQVFWARRVLSLNSKTLLPWSELAAIVAYSLVGVLPPLGIMLLPFGAVPILILSVMVYTLTMAYIFIRRGIFEKKKIGEFLRTVRR